MLKQKILMAIGVVVVAALAGVGGATFAGSRPTQDRPRDPGPAAIAANISSELKFVPVTPCRAVDTREVGGKIAASSNRAFDLFGTDLSGQGGSASGCGVPSYASAVAMNIIAVEPDGTGYLRGSAQNFFGFPVPSPTATLLSFAAGPPRSNEVPLSVCRPITGFLFFSCAGSDEIRLFAYLSATHVVVDVLGYYVEPVFATVDGDPGADPVVYRSSGVGTVTRFEPGTYVVETRRDIRGCAIVVTSGASDDAQLPTRTANASFEIRSASDLRIHLTDDSGAAVDGEFTFYAAC